MKGGVTRLGALPSLLGRVTLSAGVTICHVNVSPQHENHVDFTLTSNRFHVFTLSCHWRTMMLTFALTDSCDHFGFLGRNLILLYPLLLNVFNSAEYCISSVLIGSLNLSYQQIF